MAELVTPHAAEFLQELLHAGQLLFAVMDKVVPPHVTASGVSENEAMPSFLPVAETPPALQEDISDDDATTEEIEPVIGEGTEEIATSRTRHNKRARASPPPGSPEY